MGWGLLATVGPVRVATWNVNSVKQRVPRLLPWLDQRQPDVVCLQETKLADEAFTDAARRRARGRGYAVAVHGEARWNGVAILSRVGLDDVVTGICRARRASPSPRRARSPRPAAASGCTRCTCRTAATPDSDHYHYKLAWLAALRAVGARPARRRAMVCGDMNIAPTDADVFDPAAYVGQTHVTAPERAALASLQAAGPARRGPGPLAGRAGLHLLGLPGRDVPPGPRACGSTWCSPPRRWRSRVRAAWVDRQARKGTGPSDHAPVIVDLDEAPDGDIGPVVPPPSARAPEAGSVRLPQSR